MRPALEPGDRLLVRYGATPRAGALVLARFADGTLAVKRVAYAATTASGRPGWFLLSDNAEAGVDSRHRGPVPEDGVLAVVRLRVLPRSGRIPPG
ncbi:peptidase S24 [Nocardioides marmorisolisilvae]|uniref:Peptidase S24 n=2 Tax=Nocardioides marmorisolisilvae TaxID=1542737 RepID=A0A3N0DYE7_9ACTN|nr:peptidase S24 [Nocardioides marmorisolisilvae]